MSGVFLTPGNHRCYPPMNDRVEPNARWMCECGRAHQASTTHGYLEWTPSGQLDDHDLLTQILLELHRGNERYANDWFKRAPRERHFI